MAIQASPLTSPRAHPMQTQVRLNYLNSVSLKKNTSRLWVELVQSPIARMKPCLKWIQGFPNLSKSMRESQVGKLISRSFPSWRRRITLLKDKLIRPRNLQTKTRCRKMRNSSVISTTILLFRGWSKISTDLKRRTILQMLIIIQQTFLKMMIAS